MASAPASIMALAADRVPGCHNNLDPIPEFPLHSGHHFQSPVVVSVRSINYQHVYSRIHESVARIQESSLVPMPAPTRRRPSSSLVACGYCSVLTKSFTVIRPVSLLLLSTIGSFSTLCAQQVESSICGNAFLCDDQRDGGHNVGHFGIGVDFETHVAVGANTDQGAVLFHYWKTEMWNLPQRSSTSLMVISALQVTGSVTYRPRIASVLYLCS